MIKCLWLAGVVWRIALLACQAQATIDASGWSSTHDPRLPVWEHHPEYSPSSIDPNIHSILPFGDRTLIVEEAAPVLPPQPWIRAQSEASSSQNARGAEFLIPAFRHHDQLLGPYSIGARGFEPKAYPIKISVFQHLYSTGNPASVDFETFLNARASDLGKQLRTHGNAFRPEPQRLLEIQHTIWTSLKAHGRKPHIVSPEADLPLREGEWLWPPTEFTPDQKALQVPEQILQLRYRKSITKRFNSHFLPDPTMYHLTVPTFGANRHILAFPVAAKDYLSHRIPARSSQLWFFFEGMRDGVNKMVFLGASFLPKESERILLQSGTIKPAFEAFKAAYQNH